MLKTKDLQFSKSGAFDPHNGQAYFAKQGMHDYHFQRLVFENDNHSQNPRA